MEIKCGMIVKSVAGHDKNKFYLVVNLKEKRAFIVDGKKRLLGAPKAKNLIHLKVTKNVVDVVKYDTNKKVRHLLHDYNYN